MKIDIHTLALVLGITYLLQLAAIFLQFLINKSYWGIGWWLASFTSVALGFLFILLREFQSIELISILAANTLLMLGSIFLYVGILRFLDRKEDLRVVLSIIAGFILPFLYFLYIQNSISMRIVIIGAAVGLVLLSTSHALFVHKSRSFAASANFNALVLLSYGSFYIIRSAATLTGGSIEDVFTPTLIQSLAFTVPLIEGMLLTFGLIIMVNQRLNFELNEAKDRFELIFNASPDSTLISGLEDGKIIDTNDGYTNLSGFTREESIGKLSTDINIWENPADRKKLVAELTETGYCMNLEAVFHRKDSSRFAGMVSAKKITLRGLPHILSVTRDISERKKAEEEIKSLLTEKELLLREVHHRIKNNMSTILSLLSLHSGTLDDDKAISALRDARGRIRSMMIIYDKLYRSADFREVSAAMYFNDLIHDICSTFHAAGRVAVEQRVDDLVLDSKALFPLGIIVNELMSNSFKYAFPGDRPGAVTISLERLGDGAMEFNFTDDGVGMPPEDGEGKTKGFGLDLVHMLARELGGTVKLSVNNGTRFGIVFNPG